MIDYSISWMFICIGFLISSLILSWTGHMPKIVRVNVMAENITYFWTSCSMFFWLGLMLYMILGQDPPLMFNVTHFMFFILIINITQHGMIRSFMSLGECTELSLWRAQQMYTVAAPLYIMAILEGTWAAWGIAWKNQDLSAWKAGDHGEMVVRVVTIWITFIWLAFIFCLCWTIAKFLGAEILGNSTTVGSQVGALCMLGMLSITIWDPLLTVWDLGKMVDRMAKDKDNSPWSHFFANMFLWCRGKGWIVRYCTDFGLPVLILCGLTGGVGLLELAAYATSAQTFKQS